MSVIDLFRKRAELLSGNPGNPSESARVTATGHATQGGNPGNPSESARVTATGHATQGGNPGNPGNPENNIDKVLIEKSRPKKDGVYCYRTTENPKSVLVMVAPESDLKDAWESLRQKYGDRLVEVYPMPITKH